MNCEFCHTWKFYFVQIQIDQLKKSVCCIKICAVEVFVQKCDHQASLLCVFVFILVVFYHIRSRGKCKKKHNRSSLEPWGHNWPLYVHFNLGWKEQIALVSVMIFLCSPTLFWALQTKRKKYWPVYIWCISCFTQSILSPIILSWTLLRH